MTAIRKLGKNARIELRVTDQLKNYLVLKAAENNKTLNDYVSNILLHFEYVVHFDSVSLILVISWPYEWDGRETARCIV